MLLKVTLLWFISPVMFFKAFKIGSSWWTMSWGVVRKKATRKMNRFATNFFRFTHCLLSERFSQIISFGGGAYLWGHVSKMFVHKIVYQTLHLSGLMATFDWGGLNLGNHKSHFREDNIFILVLKSYLKFRIEFLWSRRTVRAWLMLLKVTKACGQKRRKTQWKWISQKATIPSGDFSACSLCTFTFSLEAKQL